MMLRKPRFPAARAVLAMLVAILLGANAFAGGPVCPELISEPPCPSPGATGDRHEQEHTDGDVLSCCVQGHCASVVLTLPGSQPVTPARPILESRAEAGTEGQGAPDVFKPPRSA